MNREEKFFYDIDNMKIDFAIENMTISDEDIRLLKMYSNNEITFNDMIEQAKNSII